MILACVSGDRLPISRTFTAGQLPVAEVATACRSAFLSRQTDLIAACAATGRAINLKGQFMAPATSARREKAQGFGAMA
jgi:3-deoxy-D-manno-octulosonic acid (KDO) 8-phosphate synthase